MKLRTFLNILFLSIIGYLPLSASGPIPGASSDIIQTVQEESRQGRSVVREWLRHDRLPDRVSFPTRSGFALLRKEDIIMLTVNPNKGGLLLKYRRHEGLKSINCQISLSKARQWLGSFPFIQVSRSTIVNANAIEEFQGTRRDANLLMNDGSEVRVSRSMAKVLYDWMSSINDKV